ncbi:unnamed protein product [Brugia pahangi]|uniref:Uncharacterized protein n=1 Tax=Brugia pahangi TaxID=6280 RepID=A0A0N4TLF4_BRUPA|nr:unnamed protein product [Brugia pahangi]
MDGWMDGWMGGWMNILGWKEECHSTISWFDVSLIIEACLYEKALQGKRRKGSAMLLTFCFIEQSYQLG